MSLIGPVNGIAKKYERQEALLSLKPHSADLDASNIHIAPQTGPEPVEAEPVTD